MNDLIQAITNPQTLLSIVIGVLVFFTLLTLLGSMTGGADLDKRMKAVSQRRDELKRRSRAAVGSSQGGLRQTDEGFKKRVVDRLDLSRLLEDPQVAEKMMQAGLRGPRPLTTFYFFRFATHCLSDHRGPVPVLRQRLRLAGDVARDGGDGGGRHHLLRLLRLRRHRHGG